MRAHEEAEWTGLGINPEIIKTLSEMSAVAISVLLHIPVEHRSEIIANFLGSILEGVGEIVEATGGTKH